MCWARVTGPAWSKKPGPCSPSTSCCAWSPPSRPAPGRPALYRRDHRDRHRHLHPARGPQARPDPPRPQHTPPAAAARAGHPPRADHRRHHQPAPARLERPRTRSGARILSASTFKMMSVLLSSKISIFKRVAGSWRRGVPAKLGRRGRCGWSRAGVAGDRCAARAPAGAVTGSRVPDGGRAVQPGLAGDPGVIAPRNTAVVKH